MIDINALLVKHGGTPPPHHVEVDAPDGVYRGVRVTRKRAVVRGGQLRILAHALPGKVRVLCAVGDEAQPAQPVPPKRQRKRPLAVIADPKPAAKSVLDDDW